MLNIVLPADDHKVTHYSDFAWSIIIHKQHLDSSVISDGAQSLFLITKSLNLHCVSPASAETCSTSARCHQQVHRVPH